MQAWNLLFQYRVTVVTEFTIIYSHFTGDSMGFYFAEGSLDEFGNQNWFGKYIKKITKTVILYA